MKNLILFIGLFLSTIISGQTECVVDANGDYDNDEPPGCAICGNVLSSTTASKTAENFDFDFPCGEIENSQWFRLFPDPDGTIKVSILANGCENEKGIEAALYDEDFNLVSNCEIIERGKEMKVENLLNTSLHYLMIDGIEGDVCSFSLSTFNGFNQFPIVAGPIQFDVPAPRCLGSEVCFSIPPVKHASGYLWDYPLQLSPALAGGSQQDTFVCLDLDINVGGGVVVRPIGPCNNGLPIFTDLAIETQIATFIDTILCEGTCIQIKDSCFSKQGFYTIEVDNSDSELCDSIFQINLSFGEVFPSPIIECKDSLGQLFLKWSPVSGATEYIVSLNRDSILSVTDNFVLLENIPIGELLNLKVQPKGICTYLPAETSCIIQTSKIVEELLSDKINVYPNPTTGIVNIETKLQIKEIEIYDATGRLLQKEKTTSFDFKKNDSGIYFLKIKTNEGVGIKRVLVN